jgi:hypothetical protein
LGNLLPTWSVFKENGMNDTDNDALDALIVRNMAQINKALSRIWHGIYPVAFGAVTDTTREWVRAQGWKGKFEYDGSDSSAEFWCAPPDWISPDGDRRHDCYAYFEFDYFDTDFKNTADDDQDEIVTLLGAGVGATGFHILRGDGATIAKGPWKRLMQASGIIGVMRSLGCKQYEGSYYIPISFSAEALAVAIEQGDMSIFLAPLKEALDRLPDIVFAMQSIIQVASNSQSGTAVIAASSDGSSTTLVNSATEPVPGIG